MRNIRLYLLQFVKEEVKAGYVFCGFLLLSILIYLNYWHNLNQNFLSNHSNWLLNFTGSFLLYFIPFAIAFFLQPFFFKKNIDWKNKWFWIMLFLGPVIFALRVNSAVPGKWILEHFESSATFYSTCLNWITQALVVIVMVAFVWRIKDFRVMPLYGTKKLKEIRPYLYMILVMIPLISLAATQKDFLSKYPTAQVLFPITSLPGYFKLLVFEFCYGISFLSIEFFFRGFLVLSLLHCCGTKSIIPIASFYVAIHMGKPMGEAISSFFGGILLGVVTYHTRSIWGGLIVHLGIAWLMELAGTIGRHFI